MLTPEQEVRFQRQIRLPQIGAAGQARLDRARVAVVGCGGLGSLLSQIMVRMGVGRITAIDGDRPELSNLHRQLLYDETDIADGRPKARAAADLPTGTAGCRLHPSHGSDQTAVRASGQARPIRFRSLER